MFNRAVGICEQCYQGFEIVDGICVKIDIANSVNRGCRKFENNVCVECSRRFFFNADNICTPINDNCEKWTESGVCENCYRGYLLENGDCVLDTSRPEIEDLLCAEFQEGICLSCAERAFFNVDGKCTPVNDNCNTWDRMTGECLTCYKGYELNNR